MLGKYGKEELPIVQPGNKWAVFRRFGKTHSYRFFQAKRKAS
jgi:hypothetical protein